MLHQKKVHENVEPLKRDCPGEVVILPCWLAKLDCPTLTSTTIRGKAEVCIVLNYINYNLSPKIGDHTKIVTLPEVLEKHG